MLVGLAVACSAIASSALALPIDPWSFLPTTPGVALDATDVGGILFGAQPRLVGPGAPGEQTCWAIDGSELTDVAALGGSPAYYDLFALEEIEIATGGAEASTATAGVAVNLVTKRGTNEWRGSARWQVVDGAWSERGDVAAADLARAGAWNRSSAQHGPLAGAAVEQSVDAGVEAGGPQRGRPLALGCVRPGRGRSPRRDRPPRRPRARRRTGRAQLAAGARQRAGALRLRERETAGRPRRRGRARGRDHLGPARARERADFGQARGHADLRLESLPHRALGAHRRRLRARPRGRRRRSAGAHQRRARARRRLAAHRLRLRDRSQSGAGATRRLVLHRHQAGEPRAEVRRRLAPGGRPLALALARLRGRLPRRDRARRRTGLARARRGAELPGRDARAPPAGHADRRRGHAPPRRALRPPGVDDSRPHGAREAEPPGAAARGRGARRRALAPPRVRGRSPGHRAARRQTARTGADRPRPRPDPEPLRPAAGRLHRRSDYEPVSVTGVLPNGEPYAATAWRLRRDLPSDGGRWLENGEREREYLGFAATLDKRLSNNWRLRGHLSWIDWTWKVPEREREDPTVDFGGGADGDPVLACSGSGAGPRGNVCIGPGWAYSWEGLVQLAPDRAWGFDLGAALRGHQGYPLPYVARSDPRTVADDCPAGGCVLVAGASDRFRLDDQHLLDLRLAKGLNFDRTALTVALDGFNLFDRKTVVERSLVLGEPRGDHALDALAPRTFRLGLFVSVN